MRFILFHMTNDWKDRTWQSSFYLVEGPPQFKKISPAEGERFKSDGMVGLYKLVLANPDDKFGRSHTYKNGVTVSFDDVPEEGEAEMKLKIALDGVL